METPARREAVPGTGRVVSVVVPTLLTAAVGSGSAIALVLSGSVALGGIGGLGAPVFPGPGGSQAALPRVQAPAGVPAPPKASTARPQPVATTTTSDDDDRPERVVVAEPVTFERPPAPVVTTRPTPAPTTTTPAPEPEPSTSTPVAAGQDGDDDDDDDRDHHHGDEGDDDGDDDDRPSSRPTPAPTTAPSPRRSCDRHEGGGPWQRRGECRDHGHGKGHDKGKDRGKGEDHGNGGHQDGDRKDGGRKDKGTKGRETDAGHGRVIVLKVSADGSVSRR